MGYVSHSAGVKIVQRDNLMTQFKQSVTQMGPKETGTASY
jgi:hypothetical protein